MSCILSFLQSSSLPHLTCPSSTLPVFRSTFVTHSESHFLPVHPQSVSVSMSFSLLLLPPPVSVYGSPPVPPLQSDHCPLPCPPSPSPPPPAHLKIDAT